MILSLNEVDATAKKAARGAGYPWGLAEEAARATRWLCAQGQDGCGALAGLLCITDSQVDAFAPARSGTGWVGDGPVCPIQMGAALADFASDLKAGPVHVPPVRAPRLLLPFLAVIAEIMETSVEANWNSGTVTVAQGAEMMGDLPDPCRLTLSLTAAAIPSRAVLRVVPKPEDWAMLTTFAHRTYAPATAASRLKGAGAGLSDND